MRADPCEDRIKLGKDFLRGGGAEVGGKRVVVGVRRRG